MGLLDYTREFKLKTDIDIREKIVGNSEFNYINNSDRLKAIIAKGNFDATLMISEIKIVPEGLKIKSYFDSTIKLLLIIGLILCIGSLCIYLLYFFHKVSVSKVVVVFLYGYPLLFVLGVFFCRFILLIRSEDLFQELKKKQIIV